MKTLTVLAPGNISAGTRVWLTGQQASARQHLLAADKPEELAAAMKDLETAKLALIKARKGDDAAAIDKAEKAQDKAREKLNQRRLYTLNANSAFKAGEELAVDGDMDRHLESMLGVPPPAPTPAEDPAAAEKARAEAEAKAKAAEAEAEAKRKSGGKG